jgi:hypothetical protein
MLVFTWPCFLYIHKLKHGMFSSVYFVRYVSKSHPPIPESHLQTVYINLRGEIMYFFGKIQIWRCLSKWKIIGQPRTNMKTVSKICFQVGSYQFYLFPCKSCCLISRLRTGMREYRAWSTDSSAICSSACFSRALELP